MYVCIYVCVYIYIFTYTYINIPLEAEPGRDAARDAPEAGEIACDLVEEILKSQCPGLFTIESHCRDYS
jgi:hypothetical protein